MTFNDIFKSSFVENFTSVSLLDMLLTLGLAFCVGLFIYYVYKKTCSGVMYSRSFGASLIALTMITSLVILAVTSNVVLSLGMVGALSIVRFRSAIKEPLEIALLFWAVGAGIVLAAGLIPLAVIASAVIGVVLLLFVNKKSGDAPYMAVITAENALGEEAADDCVRANVSCAVVKSKTVRMGMIETSYEVRLENGNTSFITELTKLDGVKSAVLVSFNGDYAG